MTAVALWRSIPGRDSALGQFLRFAAIGTIGFVADSGTLLFAIRVLPLDLYSGRVLSFLVAATCTWALNRRFTFARTPEHPFVQWLRFLGANGIGFAANYGTYAVLVTFTAAAKAYPVLGVAAGAVAGLAFNFTVNKFWVFKAKH